MSDLTERFREIARHVAIPHPWDPAEFLRSVAEYRGRPITLHDATPEALAGTGCGTGSGLWIGLQDEDLIFYSADTEWHADHIICHEVGHMLLGHGGDIEAAWELPLQSLLPSIPPEALRSVLRRSDYGTTRELEAESFADLVMVEATLPRRQPSLTRSTFFRARHR
ncbi:hypothetical protein JGU71_28895 [Antrihabitans sp. YC3-6]|uniref:IrrE N-terminal-like domain-containing protein n=1 Tax=Antrihabitans stalagmiti TaxID=2799499 RepID=A0A934U6T9_9NOCA|nr:hypothetical protein [Antrihabitans stalagmiti]MBJ8342915.1 hypothetical protein [Antrihabitans stalagmiti]